MRKCSTCGRMLEDSDFYVSDKYRCKECHRKQKKASYDKYHPQVYMGDEGRLLKRSQGHPYIFWNGNMISDLKRYYPNTSNQELVELFGVSERTIVRKARELGLSKSKEHVSKVNKGKSVLAHIVKRKRRINKNYGENKNQEIA